ncbi:MAG: MBL fold metallo-hydrolase [Bacteroidota bacterium]
MQLTVLVDNSAGSVFGAEHGLSYLVESNGTKVLFDTGYTDLFKRNAQLLNLDLDREIDTVVLSHGHWDHGDGLQHMEGKRLITHPSSFIKRYRKRDHSNVGLKLTREEIEGRYSLSATEGPHYITPDILFLGAIPRKNDFESKTTPFVDQNGDPDFVPDDSGICIIQDQQLVVISGCAHAGICNIIDHAMELTGIGQVKAVIGGFHLKHQSQQLKRTIAYLEEIGSPALYPSHCTELPALAAFYDSFKIAQLKTGMILNF